MCVEVRSTVYLSGVVDCVEDHPTKGKVGWRRRRGQAMMKTESFEESRDARGHWGGGADLGKETMCHTRMLMLYVKFLICS